MIKVIGLRAYTDYKNNRTGVKREEFAGKLTAKSVPDLFRNHHKILEIIPEDQRFNLHYNIYNCYEAEFGLFHSLDTIPIDIDDIDQDKLESYIVILEEVFETPRTSCAVVSSGHGLHWLIQTKNVVDSAEKFSSLKNAYALLCKTIESKMKSQGLTGKVDSAIWRMKGTLRMPGTMNAPISKDHEQFPPKKCEALFYDMKITDFDLKNFATKIPKTETIPDESLRAYPVPDTKAVLEGCDFIKWAFEFPDDVLEPQWYAALSIVGRLEDGRTLAHKMSEGHHSYKFDETDAKIDQAIGEFSGARTCKNIESLSDKCLTCKFRGKVTSPIRITGPDYIKTVNTGFWEMGQKGGKGPIIPIKPAYEDLRRYFEQKKGSYHATEEGKVYQWTGKFWEHVDEMWLKNFPQEFMDPKPMSNHVSEFVNLCLRTNNIASNWFMNSTDRKLNMQNGVLDLTTMQMIPSSKQYGFKYVLPYAYDPEAKCPTFDKFMEAVTLGRKDLENVILEFFGYAFSGMEYIHHKAMIFSGEGANGKSTLLSVLRKLSGNSAYSTLMLSQLNDEKYKIQLIGKLFNVSEETPKKSLEDSSTFKILSSGGEMMGRGVYEKPVSFINRAKFVYACNELPSSNDFTEGFYRRFMIVPFDASFRGDVADKNMDKKLEAELPGILNRVIEGYHRLIRQGNFTKSTHMEEAMEGFKKNGSSVAEWMEEELRVTKNDKDFIPNSVLYPNYVEWCDRFKYRPVGKKRFGAELRSFGADDMMIRVKDKVYRGRVGVKFISEMAEIDEPSMYGMSDFN